MGLACCLGFIKESTDDVTLEVLEKTVCHKDTCTMEITRVHIQQTLDYPVREVSMTRSLVCDEAHGGMIGLSLML